jgi:prefoldin subunit 5
MTCRLRLEGPTAQSLQLLLEAAGHDVDFVNDGEPDQPEQTASTDARADGRALVTANPRLADADIWEAAAGWGLIILCFGIERLTELLDHLYAMRLNSLQRLRRSIDAVTSAKKQTEALIEDRRRGTADLDDEPSRMVTGQATESANTLETRRMSHGTEVNELTQQLEQLERQLRSLVSDLSLLQCQAESFKSETLAVKACYTVGRVESLVEGCSWESPDVELDAIAANLLEALSASGPQGHVWIVTADATWAGPAPNEASQGGA